jgi:glucosyl-dolichyl phosphate glucuronosyltransferase
MDISIIIPTVFDRPIFMADLLGSIASQKGVTSSFETILVDNNPEAKNELKQIADQWGKELPIRLIHVPQNGLHHARHAGARAASASILIYIDDDVRALPEWLSAYERFFNHSDRICAGGKVIPEWEGIPEDWVSDVPSDIFSLLDYGNESRILKPREGINGCNFAIRREALFENGGFHPDGFLGSENRFYRGDGEYGLIQNIKKGGKNIHYLPDAVIQHRIPKSRLETKSIKKAMQAYAIGRAYHFARNYKCSPLSILSLIVGGKLLEAQSRLGWTGQVNSASKQKRLFLSVKYATIAEYGVRLLRDGRLRKYVLRADYLENSETRNGISTI